MKRFVWGLAAIGLAVCLILALRGFWGESVTQSVVEASDQPRSIAFDDLEFQEPMVQQRLRKFEQAARSIAGVNWQHVPWHWRAATGGTPETHYIFATQWCSRPSGKAYCICSRDTNPCHMIDLVASPKDMKVGQPKMIYSWSLIARKYPKDVGWGVRISYRENWYRDKQIQEHFSVDLHRSRWSRGETYEPTLRLPCDNYELRAKFDAVEYVFSADLEDKRPQPFVARQYVASPAQLRETVLAAQDALEAFVAEKIDSGEATRVLDHDLLVSAPPTSNPPIPGPPMPKAFESPIPAKYAPSPEQKKQLREQMAAELEQRRQLVRDNAEEIHAAIEATFPLGKLLNELNRERPPSAP